MNPGRRQPNRIAAKPPAGGQWRGNDRDLRGLTSSPAAGSCVGPGADGGTSWGASAIDVVDGQEQSSSAQAAGWSPTAVRHLAQCGELPHACGHYRLSRDPDNLYRDAIGQPGPLSPHLRRGGLFACQAPERCQSVLTIFVNKSVGNRVE